ncbi:MAG: peptidylprolyl isomerase [Planctomycetes bacterium]|nr:peptidylprolyl isomerase [Planctomycetota bacterium]
MDQTVSAGKVVGIYYTLKNKDGAVLDTNRRGGKPMPFLQGTGNILPALEKALEGKCKNDFLAITLEPEQGYGHKRADLVRKVPRANFPKGRELAPGMRLTGKDPDGRMRMALIVEVGEQEVTVDENHPLAGETLYFEITVCGVRDATAEETQHGHAHGPGGHAH